jgi:uncharacterized protein (DUF427 family)
MDRPEHTHSSSAENRIAIEPSARRLRVIFNGKTIADSLATLLLREKGHMSVYYFPRQDVRMDLLERTNHGTHCPYKGDASYWTLAVGGRRVENAVWSYEAPIPQSAPIKEHLAFYWNKVDHWFEEDEEIFGHPRDPYHRVDVTPARVACAWSSVARRWPRRIARSSCSRRACRPATTFRPRTCAWIC